MKFITSILFVDKDVVAIRSDFQIKDSKHALELIDNLELLFIDLKKFNENKGYINSPKLNIPSIITFIRELKLRDKSILTNEKLSVSIPMNTLYYNLLLLIIVKLLLDIERWFNNHKDLDILCNDDTDYGYKVRDRLIDLKNLRGNVLRMIHPFISTKMKNKGVSVLLNTIAGFDSEYELKSSLEMVNELLSVQLASYTNLYVKVPRVEPLALNYKELKIHSLIYWGEFKYIKGCCLSIDTLVADIRSILYSENDKFLKLLINKLDSIKELKSYKRMDGFNLYVFPNTDIKTLIKYTDIYSSKELIMDADNLCNDEHGVSLRKFLELLDSIPHTYLTNTSCDIISSNEVGGDIDNDNDNSKEISNYDYDNSKELSRELSNNNNKTISMNSLFSRVEECINKPKSRMTYRITDKKKLHISINRVLYLCMHESAADLSMLCDFEALKEEFDIVDRSFITRGRPLTFDFCRSSVHVRDTILLAPQGCRALSALGNIYGDDYKKVDIGKYRQGRMKELLNDNKSLFEEYAIKDSLITLQHASQMELFNLTVDKIGIPITLSGISKAYVVKEWKGSYKGYQVHSELSVGNLMSKITPKDARSTVLSKYLIAYIAGYRGGRNESFMYGVDTINNGERNWIDYDLTSAYTTVMSILGHPDIDKTYRVFNKTVEKMTDDTLLYNYIVLEVNFEFDSKVKYPCIPTRVDDDVDIYPLTGHSVITGVEYLVARSMGCKLHVTDGVMIPIEINKSGKNEKQIYKYEELSYIAPFRHIIKELQHKRRQYPKKTFYNYMYKEIGNSIYGQVGMGISGKTRFDVKSKSHVRLEGGILSNPILSSYITGFTRALIGECMNNIQRLNGSIVSVTTDGFITDVNDLEDKLLRLDRKNIKCLNLYRNVRKYLTTFENEKTDERALEIKNIESQGLISWKTRGQLGFTNGGISAISGFQSRFIDKEFLIDEFSKYLNDDNISNVFEYVQTGLRSATDIYKRNGHVIAKYKDQKYSLDYDNKRRIIEASGSETFKDSLPWKNVQEYERIRSLKSLVNTPKFDAVLNYKGYDQQPSKSYKSYIETGVRGFIKACLSENELKRYGIPIGFFKNYKSIIDFIYGHEPSREVKLSVNNISKLKGRVTISRAVPRTIENESFVEYVKTHINTFNTDRFFREYSEAFIKERHKLKKEG